VEVLTKQLGQILGSLEHSWNRTHRLDYEVTMKTPSEGELLGIAGMLEKQYDDVRSRIIVPSTTSP
jgi:hypothetical protein